MGVKDVRITPGLNQAIWSRGVKSPPRRIRVRLERKRNDDEGAKEKLYVVASVVEGVTSFKVGLWFQAFPDALCTLRSWIWEEAYRRFIAAAVVVREASQLCGWG